MTKKEKEKLFEAMLYLEHQQDKYVTNDSVRKKRFYESEGAFYMLEELGIGREYIRWAIGK